MKEKFQTCSKCKKKLPIIDFYFQKKRQAYRKDCKFCVKEKVRQNHFQNKDSKLAYNKSYYKKNKDDINKQKQTYRLSPEGAWTSFKGHKSNLSITKEQFIDWYIKTPEKCAYCESDFNEVKQFLSKNDIKIRRVDFDIDRKDNEKGYEISNIVKSCVVCNYHKADFYSYNDFRKVSLKYIKNKIKSLD